MIGKKVPECVTLVIICNGNVFLHSFKTLKIIRDYLSQSSQRTPHFSYSFFFPPDSDQVAKQMGPCYVGKWKWKKTVMGRSSGKFQKGEKEECIFGANVSVCKNTAFYISPVVFGLRKRGLWNLVASETRAFPDWKPFHHMSGKFCEWAVYVLRWLRFSLQKNACLGASPTPAPALFPWPAPMSPPMVWVGGAVTTRWKCPSVPSSFQTSLCTAKTSAAS